MQLLAYTHAQQQSHEATASSLVAFFVILAGLCVTDLSYHMSL